MKFDKFFQAYLLAVITVLLALIGNGFFAVFREREDYNGFVAWRRAKVHSEWMVTKRTPPNAYGVEVRMIYSH